MKTLAAKLPLQLTPETLARVNRFLPVVLTLLLVTGCSYLLSQITWALIPDNSSALPTQNQRTDTVAAAHQRTDYSHISQAHLFGIYQQSTASPQTQDAPDTRLNLVLKGVLSADPMSKASVIISLGKNGKEDMYGIGDEVASATLKEIYADRVILQRSGQLETLRMPEEFNDDFITSSPAEILDDSSTQIDTSSPGAALSDIREEILANPTSFGKYAIPVPFKENGRLIGYRLTPQGDRTLFDVVGLDPQDVVIAVNGVQLDDPAEGLKALRELQSASQVNITVLRNGAELPLQFDIP